MCYRVHPNTLSACQALYRPDRLELAYEGEQCHQLTFVGLHHFPGGFKYSMRAKVNWITYFGGLDPSRDRADTPKDRVLAYGIDSIFQDPVSGRRRAGRRSQVGRRDRGSPSAAVIRLFPDRFESGSRFRTAFPEFPLFFASIRSGNSARTGGDPLRTRSHKFRGTGKKPRSICRVQPGRAPIRR